MPFRARDKKNEERPPVPCGKKRKNIITRGKKKQHA